MILRPALPEDEGSIAILDERCFPNDGWAIGSVGHELRRRGACCLAMTQQEGALTGYALGWAIAGEAELLRIAIDPVARGQGRGAALLGAFMSQAIASGAEAIHLEVRDDNAAAIALYERAGFLLGPLRPAYYGDGCAARLYRFDVAQPGERP